MAKTASACSQPQPWAIATTFDLAANGQLSAQFPQIPTPTGIRTVPPSLLKSVGWVESGWRQLTPQGRPVLSFDFGYGIMQITSGMAGAYGRIDGTLEPDLQSQIASDYRYNIAYGARMLAEKWSSTPKIGDADPAVVENWYYALWAYNGWGWTNNPNNPRFSRIGTPATNPAAFPYQERVLYLVAHPPHDNNGNVMWRPVTISLPSRKSIGTHPGALPIVKHPHRQPPPALAAIYHADDLGALYPGIRHTVSVHVTNTGTQPWGNSGASAVALAYHIFTLAGNPDTAFSPLTEGILAFGQGAVALPRVLLPGNSVTLHPVLLVPGNPGRYRVVWDLQQGTDVWFSQTGTLPGIQSIHVLGIRETAQPLRATSTPTAGPREGVMHLADTSIRVGAVLSPHQAFRKGWLVFNNGSTQWTADWTLRHISGNSFGATHVHVPFVLPCHSGVVIAPLVAPKDLGRFTGTWQMEDATGRRLGPKLTVVVLVRSKSYATPTPVAWPSPTSSRQRRPAQTPTPVG